MKKLIAILSMLVLAAPVFAQNRTAFAGVRNATDYAYGVQAGTTPLIVDAPALSTANTSTTYTINTAYTTAGDGTVFYPLSLLAPITITDANGSDTATPTAVSGCNSNQGVDSCTVTVTFTNAHGKGARITSGTFGLQEALDLSQNSSFYNGRVAIGPGWGILGGTNSTIIAANIVPGVVIEDNRSAAVTYWYPQAGATTALAIPTTLTSSTAVPSTTPAGSYGTGTYYMCVAYVDIMGQEGGCSATFSQAGLASGSFVFSPPAASTGAVGYTIYISLTSGTYSLAYKVPLTSTVCTLTALESVTPACAVTNSTYGQTGATASVTAITVNTSPILLLKTVTSTTAITQGTPNGRTTYAYSPGSGLALSGITGASFPFGIAVAATTTTPQALGTINIAPGFMNAVGKKIRVCGYGTMASTTAATIEGISLQWDSFGQNTAGLPVKIADMTATPTSANSGSVLNVSFCTNLVTTVAGTGATAGTILPYAGQSTWGVTSAGVQPTSAPLDTTAAVGSLNLASEARLHVVYTHTTGTDGAGFTLNGITIESL